jgi:hypothetical protein
MFQHVLIFPLFLFLFGTINTIKEYCTWEINSRDRIVQAVTNSEGKHNRLCWISFKGVWIVIGQSWHDQIPQTSNLFHIKEGIIYHDNSNPGNSNITVALMKVFKTHLNLKIFFFNILRKHLDQTAVIQLFPKIYSEMHWI